MKKIILCLSLFLCGLASWAQAPEIAQDVQENIKARITTERNVGIVVGLIEGEEVTYFSYGKTAVENGKPVTEEAVFEIGSISKVFTTILLSDQLLQGKMKLTDPLTAYLPKTVKVPSRNGKAITLKDLATHSSGLPRMPNNFAPANPNNPFADYTIAQLYEFLSNYELPRDVGASYEYSNVGMGLLGHILELHSGKSYEELIAEHFNRGYGMEHTGLRLSKEMKARLALGHAEGVAVENWDIVSLAGAGGIRSTAQDMVKFIQANMGVIDSPLQEAMNMSHAPAYKNETQNFEMGLGWHYANNGEIIWHNGGTGGYRTFAGFLKGTQKGVVVLSNSNESIDDIGLKLLNPALSLKTPKKKVVPQIVEVSENVLEQYVGRYELTPTFSITVTKEGKKLFLQATGQPKFEVFPSAQNEFFLTVVEASITFNADSEGKIESLTLHQGGQNPVGKKVE
ncbi:serine hydrolase [Spongiimicrobium salis]|uniref:serine hydrolase n=1 Tax=Spongiimicrobium salis TaxID=1667022 RepID=UPI00374D4968